MALIDRVNDSTLRFFDRTDEEKVQFSSKLPGSRGYSAMRGRTIGRTIDRSVKISSCFKVHDVMVEKKLCFKEYWQCHKFVK